MISVIVPTFNRANYLKECISSLLNQSFKDIEIIVVDDGSTDNTANIVKNFNNERIRYINKGKMPNISKLRNLGVSHSNFDIIAFCDDDDLWFPNKLEEQLKYIDHYDFICSNSNIINSAGGVIQNSYFPKIKDNLILKPSILLKQSFILTPTVLFKKRILHSKYPFDEKIFCSYCEDYNLWIKLSFSTEILFLSKPLVSVRKHLSQTSSSTSQVKLIEAFTGIVKNYENKLLGKGIMESASVGILLGNIALFRIFLSAGHYIKSLALLGKILFEFRKVYILNSFVRKIFLKEPLIDIEKFKAPD